MIGIRDTMRVAAEIAQHLQRAAERRFGIDDPAPQMQSPEQLRKLFRTSKQGRRPVAEQFALFRSRFNPAMNLPRNTFRSTGIGRKK
jgi:hypothetical protein